MDQEGLGELRFVSFLIVAIPRIDESPQKREGTKRGKHSISRRWLVKPSA
jgi:hypothetical protein